MKRVALFAAAAIAHYTFAASLAIATFSESMEAFEVGGPTPAWAEVGFLVSTVMLSPALLLGGRYAATAPSLLQHALGVLNSALWVGLAWTLVAAWKRRRR